MSGTGYDVVVVGGGLVGTALAYELVSAGASTVLVDAHHPGRATDAGAGILSPETSQDPDPRQFAFGRAAARYYETLAAHLLEDGVGDLGYAVTGSMLISERPGDDWVMDAAARLIGERCPGIVEEIDPGDVVRSVPVLGPVRRALLNPLGRRVDGRVLTGRLREVAVSRGIRVVEAQVTGIFPGGAGRAGGVHTSAGDLGADAVIIAGGAWSPAMAASLGTPLPITPLKGQIVHLATADDTTGTWPIVQPVLSYYLVPWPDGRVVCGGTMEAEAGFDIRTTAGGLEQLLRECLRTAPGLAGATVLEVRVGLRPATPDGRPVLGPVPGWENVSVATGHGADGLLLGPYSARVVARTALGIEVFAEPEAATLAAAVLDACSCSRFAA